MKFNNIENKCHNIEDKEIWISRSVVVVGMIIMKHKNEYFILMGRRGELVPNEVGKFCMPCGYLDSNETCEEAIVREIWEETKFNVLKAVNELDVIYDHMHFPWKINSEPDGEHQNVSMHYAVCFKVDELPELAKIKGDEPKEVDELMWMNSNEIFNYDIAFNHENTIKVFMNSLPERLYE